MGTQDGTHRPTSCPTLIQAALSLGWGRKGGCTVGSGDFWTPLSVDTNSCQTSAASSPGHSLLYFLGLLSWQEGQVWTSCPVFPTGLCPMLHLAHVSKWHFPCSSSGSQALPTPSTPTPFVGCSEASHFQIVLDLRFSTEAWDLPCPFLFDLCPHRSYLP